MPPRQTTSSTPSASATGPETWSVGTLGGSRCSPGTPHFEGDSRGFWMNEDDVPERRSRSNVALLELW